MVKKAVEVIEEAEVRGQLALRGFIADMERKKIKLSEIMDEVAPTGVKLPTDNVVGRTFTIIRARAFESSFQEQTHAYFVVGYDDEEDLLFNTVLGGAAVVDILDLWAAQGRREPIEVKLVWNEGGKYKGYYTLE